MTTPSTPPPEPDQATASSPESAIAFWAALQHHDARFTADESEELYGVYRRGLAELAIIRQYAAEAPHE